MSAAYWIGLATIPALLVGGYVAAWLIAQAVVIAGRLSLGAVHRFDPGQSRMTREKRAAVFYGLRRGIVFSRGEFVLTLGHGLDEERRHWASERLLKRVALADFMEGEKS